MAEDRLHSASVQQILGIRAAGELLGLPFGPCFTALVLFKRALAASLEPDKVGGSWAA